MNARTRHVGRKKRSSLGGDAGLTASSSSSSALSMKGGAARVQQSALLSLYRTAPQDEISLDEFETFALDRLQLLRGLDLLRTRLPVGGGGGGDNMLQEMQGKVQELVQRHMPLRSYEGSEEDRRKDLISHFILRLAYCRTEDLRRWFLQQECALFKHRLGQLSEADREAFMHANGLDYVAVTHEEKMARQEHLARVNLQQGQMQKAFYKVPFTQALDLVGQRNVYLEGGMAYVPIGRLHSIIVARFRTHLSRSLLNAAHMFGSVVSQDPRVAPLLTHMNQQYVGRDYGTTETTETITAGQIPELADQSFPLCMRQLQRALKQHHHLRHWGRLQYGLFIKGIGVPLEEAMIFWQTEFTKGMPLEKFTKNYAYNIRHMYGKEGKRTNYTPYSCPKIILGATPGTGEFHGCPFKHYDDQHLAPLLAASHVDDAARQDMMRLKHENNFSIACLRHFEATHPNAMALGVSLDGVGNHPNAWAQASMRYHAARAAAANGGAPPAGPVGAAAQRKRGLNAAEPGMKAEVTVGAPETPAAAAAVAAEGAGADAATASGPMEVVQPSAAPAAEQAATA